MAAIVEQHNDQFGIKWPLNVAPYHVVVCPVSMKDDAQKNLANKIYEELRANHVEVILDDRDQGLGFKMKDWELIGIPYVIVCGRKASEGVVEFKTRSTNEKVETTPADAVNTVVTAVKNI